MNKTLDDLKGLTLDQYEDAKGRALARIARRIGDKPERARFSRELGQIATPLDGLALIVFVAALAMSSLHIVQYMTAQAIASFDEAGGSGIVISQDVYTVAHQVGAVLLAEAAALLFMTMHAMSAPSRAQRSPWLRWVSVPLGLALVAAAFVLVANLSSGVNLLVAVMPPIFTLGIAARLEQIIVTMLRRRDEVTARYLAALEQYEISSADPTRHPDYQQVLRQEIWARLVALPSNRDFRDAPAGFKAAAVRRELQREAWASEPVQEVTQFEAPLASQGERQRLHSGSSRPGPDVLEFTQTIGPVSAPGITAISMNGHNR